MSVTKTFRSTIISALCSALEAHPGARAAWLGGSAAFDRLDEYSDIDVCAVVQDGQAPDVFEAVERALRDVVQIELQVPVPNTAGFLQRFYRFAGRSEFEVLDLALLPYSRPPMFLEQELHGKPTVLFDHDDLIREVHVDTSTDLDAANIRAKELRPWFQMFQHLALKSRLRKDAAEALAFYQAYTIRPLVEALRIRHCPHRRGFHLRYLERDLPPDVGQRITRLAFVSDLEDLARKQQEAIAWFREVIDGLP